jgi:hypothetical protein
MSVLQSLIDYRLQLEKEGFSKVHLNNYDGEINNEILNLKNEVTPDLSLINYRLQRSKEGASVEELSIIDASIFKFIGNTPAKFTDLTIRNITGSDFKVVVDLNRENIGNLYKKVAAYVGSPISKIRLIHKGKHLEFMERTLYESNIEKDSVLGITFRLGCDGRGCCDINYHMMCDALLRNADHVLNKLDESEKKHLVNIFSKICAEEELNRALANKTKELDRIKLEIEKSKSNTLEKLSLFSLLRNDPSSFAECSLLEAKCGPKEFVPNNNLIEACIKSTTPPRTLVEPIFDRTKSDDSEDLYG